MLHRHNQIPYKGTRWLFIISILICICYGLVFIYSASSIFALERLRSAHYYAQRHLIGLIIGICGLCCAYLIPTDFINQTAPWNFLCSLFLTALTIIPGISRSIHGSRRWLHLGSFSLQPSELLKYAFIVYLAYFFSKRTCSSGSLMKTYIPFLSIIAITSPILLLQPDFGTTVLLCTTAIIMAFIAGVRMKHLAYSIALLFPIALVLIYIKPYRFQRIITFLDPWADPHGAGFQIIQSFIAIGSGKFFGIGIGQSKQKFFYLPMQHTDFIFSIIAEETGFLGAALVIIFFFLLLYAGLRLALAKTDPFARYAICGFVILISLQAFINIAVATGLVPTKGIGLPFISYANSALVSTLTMLGFVMRLIVKSP